MPANPATATAADDDQLRLFRLLDELPGGLVAHDKAWVRTSG